MKAGAAAALLQDASLRYMNEFIAGRVSLMFATKAFGMGIDKADVRFTYHVNISGSIESFVQEAGRAARDGKAALCTVFFNNQKFLRQGSHDAYRLDEDGDYLPDREVLNFFYRMAFQGAIKESIMLDELLTNLLPTRVPQVHTIAQEFAARHQLEGFELKPWMRDERRRLYISFNGVDSGHYRITQAGLEQRYIPAAQQVIVRELTVFLNSLCIPFNADQFWKYLRTLTIDGGDKKGIEALLEEAAQISLTIPFQNKYYSPEDGDTKKRIISEDLRAKLRACAIFQRIEQEEIYDNGAVDIRILDSLNQSGFVLQLH